MRSSLVFLIFAPLAVAGCFTTHRADDQPPGELCPASVELLLDPSTGTCIAIAPDCGLDDGAPEPGIDHDDFAGCHSTCESLSEVHCLETAGCRAGFVMTGNGLPQYWACWATAPSGPVHTFDCTGLSALDCSRRDNCASQYVLHADGTTAFDSCAYEPGV